MFEEKPRLHQLCDLLNATHFYPPIAENISINGDGDHVGNGDDYKNNENNDKNNNNDDDNNDKNSKRSS